MPGCRELWPIVQTRAGGAESHRARADGRNLTTEASPGAMGGTIGVARRPPAGPSGGGKNSEMQGLKAGRPRAGKNEKNTKGPREGGRGGEDKTHTTPQHPTLLRRPPMGREARGREKKEKEKEERTDNKNKRGHRQDDRI